MDQAVRFASAVAERCLQDLAVPLDSIAASLAQAVSLPGPRNPHLLDAHAAATELSLRLRLLRDLWAPERAIPVRRLPDLMRGAPSWQDVRLDFSGVPARMVLSPPRARVVIAALLVALDALGRGGSVALQQAPHGAIDLEISGRAAHWPEELELMLADPKAALDTRSGAAPAALILVLLAAALRVPLALVPTGRAGSAHLRIGRIR